MPRNHIKLYLNDDWVDAINKEKGDMKFSEYIRECIQSRVKVKLSEVRVGRKPKTQGESK